MRIDNFFAELRRRNVYKVAVAYIIAGWAFSQGIAQVFPVFEVPNWLIRSVVLLIIIGLPIALVLAWTFEITPQGIKRTETADAMPGSARPKKYVWIYVVVIGVAISIGLFFLGRYTARNTASAARTEAATLPQKSIAVLPFESLSEDKGNAYFAEGVQEEILTRLAKVADLKVISRSSTQRFKSAPSDLREIARQLGVMHIVEGSVQKANDQVRVNVQLVNAMNDTHLWAEIYDRKLTDIFAVESEIAKAIADTLQAKLTGSEQRALAARPTDDSEAYQLYLQGRFFWNKRTTEGIRKSIDYFNQAITKDPNYALAYAALGQSYVILPAYDGGAPKDCFPQGEIFAKKALALDPGSSEALAVTASAKALYQFDFEGAYRDYEKGVQLHPNDATTHHWFANDVLANLGDYERELAEMRRALELDPLSSILHNNTGNAFVHNGRFDEAIAEYRKAVELDSTFYLALWNHGLLLELQGKIPEAIAQYEKAGAITNDPTPLGMLGHIYGTTGRKDEARKILEKLKKMRAERYIAAYPLAIVALGLEEKEEALKWLDQAYQDRDGNAIAPIRIDPLFKPLRGDPRFEALAEKVVPARLFKKSVTKK